MRTQQRSQREDQKYQRPCNPGDSIPDVASLGLLACRLSNRHQHCFTILASEVPISPLFKARRAEMSVAGNFANRSCSSHRLKLMVFPASSLPVAHTTDGRRALYYGTWT